MRMMWGLIALIILVSIIFGVSLHEAFWGIITFVGVVAAIGLAIGTKTGRAISKWAAFAVCCLLIYFGLSAELSDGYFDWGSWNAIEAYAGIAGLFLVAGLFDTNESVKTH